MPRSSRPRIIFPRTQAAASGEKSSQFWQSAALVLIGATITFFSAIGTGYFTSRNESRRVAVEQKVLFEKDFVSVATKHIDLVASAIQLYGMADTKDTRMDSAVMVDLDKGEREWTTTSTSFKLLMNAYLDARVCDRYLKLDSTLFSLYAEIYNGAIYASQDKDLSLTLNKFDRRYRALVNEFGDYMRDFHAAILK